MRKNRNGLGAWLLAGFALVFVGQGCTINRDILFQTSDDYTFDELVASVDAEYRIAPNDFLSFQLFSNDGQRLLAMTAGSMDGGAAGQNMNQMFMQQQNGGMRYLVQPDGRVKFPEIGWVELQGKTLDEAETLLEEKYASLYNKPYSIIRVLNNRVLVFPGASGAALVITLQNMNTTLLEALALAGGVSGRGDAGKVKLIRKTDEGNRIYFMDLSTIEGLKDAQTIVQANDIIYVEPVPEIAREVLADISPVASIVSSLSVFWAVIISANNNGN
jgi:polysaccharide export outer membrane protein